MPLMDGKTLRRVFDALCPFDKQGRLKPEGERVTILAANANTPLELQVRAFAMAAADGAGSPMIIQISHNAMRLAGGHPDSLPMPRGVSHMESEDAGLNGLALARYLLERYVDDYGPRFVSISLDHFKVPALRDDASAPSLESGLAEARLRDALEFMQPSFDDEADLSEETFRRYVAYLASPAYREFRREFLGAVKVVRPAWGMIDTEHLPPALVFAVTRDISDAVRGNLGNDDMIIEAEFGATGQSGSDEEYETLEGKDLERFARQVSAFVQYTGAGGLAYPIGMQHAAPTGERHAPDVRRLEAVHRAVLEETGRYVPFAQHGGTGASYIARGLVGKNNVNTAFLVAMASSIAQHVEANREGIDKGEKKVAGTSMYLKAMDAVRRVALEKLEETGSYGLSPRLKEEIGLD